MKYVLGFLILFGCSSSKLDFDHHKGWGGPDTWSLSGDGFSIDVYRGDCWKAPEALAEIKRRVDEGSLDWEIFKPTRADTLEYLEQSYSKDLRGNIRWEAFPNSRMADAYIQFLCDSLENAK